MTGADERASRHRHLGPRRKWGSGILLLAGLLLALGPLMPAAAASAQPLVAAHRGGALLWPENSLTAFRGALELGVDFLETDVHLTADDEVVILHDPTLDRTTTGRGRVRAAGWAELAPLRLRGRDGRVTEDALPPLSQLLDLLASGSTQLLLEIKVDADGHRYPGIEEKVLALVRGRGLAGRTVIMAFEPETVRRVRALDPSIRTALLVGKGRVERERVSSREAVRWAREVGATDLGIDHRILDAGVVEAARATGVAVGAWTVNEEADLRTVIASGVNLVTSDRPDLALRLLGR